MKNINVSQKIVKILTFSLLAPLLFNLAIAPAHASPGALDTSFGNAGVETLTIGMGPFITSIAIDSSGRIVAGGFSNDGSGDTFILARYSETGTLDTSFGNGGIETTTIGITSQINSIKIDSAGRIVVGGRSSDAITDNLTLARYTEAGKLDTTFGNGGIETATVGMRSQINSIAMDSFGRIIAGGFMNDGANDNFLVARFTETGTIDTTFGSSGFETTTIGTASQIASIAIDKSGRIVAGGTSDSGSAAYGAFARYTQYGMPDATFGNGGAETITVGEILSIGSITIDSSGKILAAGMVGIGNGELGLRPAVLRFDENGSLDTSFGVGGVTTVSSGDAIGTFSSIIAEESGRIIASGFYIDITQNNGSAAVVLVRLKNDGALDKGFGANGSVSAPLNSTFVGGLPVFPIALDGSNRVVLGLLYQDTSSMGFALMRFLNTASPSPIAYIPIPDPVQQSKVTAVSPTSAVSGTPTSVIISGNFVEQISNILINGVAIPAKSWTQSTSQITFDLPSNSPGTYSIQIFNGSSPILATQMITLTTPVIVEPTPTPTATVEPTPSPKASEAPKVKKKTIFCSNGKKSTKVTGVKPKCPKGYKAK